MKSKFLIPISLFILLFYTADLWASHIGGGNITYTCVDPITNTYEFRYTVWRDCSGINVGNSFTILLVNNCNNSTTNFSLNRDPNYQTGVEVSQLCQQILPQSSCNGGPYQGYQEYQYVGVITLNANACTSWTLYNTICCRNTSTNINNATNTSGYNSVDINLYQNTCNNSPTFTSQPIPYYCVGQTINYNPGVQEVDGDSLVFSMVTPNNGANNTVNYNAGYNLANPFGTNSPVTFDPSTGQLTCTPNTVGNFVLNYQVCEYRNGVLLGCVIREFQVVIQNCNNQTPYLSSGGVQNIQGGVTLVDSNSLEVCPGDTADFDIYFADSLLGTQVNGDSITILSNILSVLPNANVTITNGNPAILHVNFVANNTMPVFSNFVVTIEDNACPIPGLAIYQFDITKKPSVVANSDITLCDIYDTAFVQATGADTFTWSLISGDPIVPNVTMSDTTGTLGVNVWFLPSVTSTYQVVGNQTPYNCATVDTLSVIINPQLEIALDTLLVCAGDTIDLGSTITSDLACDSVYQTYNWSPATGLSATNIRNPTLVLQPGQTTATYTLEYYNGCICTSVDSIVIQVVEVDVSSGVNSATQCGQDDAQIIVSALNGIAPYSYSIDNGSSFYTNNVFDSLGGGIYAIQVMDSSGCLSPINYDTIVEFIPPVIDSIVISDETCYGISDGVINVFATSSNGSLVYSIDSLLNTQTGTTFTGLPDSSYWVGIEDTVGCKVLQSTVVGGHLPLINDSVLSSDIYCDYDTSGTIEVFVQGGVQPYTYSVDGGNSFSNTSLINNLDSGIYSIVVRDSLGCETNPQGVYIQYFESPQIDSVSSIDILCSYNSVGELEIFAQLGISPYTYSIDSGTFYSSTPIFTGLDSGVYNVFVMDSNACVSNLTQATITYFESPNIDSIQVTDETCYGFSDGSLEVFVSSGTGLINYSIDSLNTIQGSNTFNNLSDSTYIISVEDEIGCVAHQAATISGNLPLLIDSVLPSHIYCDYDTSGAIDVQGVGGVSPYTYSIDAGATFSPSSSFGNLDTGNYSIVVSDSFGCLSPVQVASILFFESPQIDAIQIADIFCVNNPVGEISINASMGSGPYQYSIDNGSSYSNTSLFTNLPSNTYNVVVMDTNGCESEVDSAYIAFLAPPVIDSVHISDETCYGFADGEIEVFASGGNGILTYTNNNWSTNQTSNLFSNLSDTTYWVVVEDTNGCTSQPHQAVVSGNPELIIDTIFTQDIFCFGDTSGQIQVLVQGGVAPYSYSINNGVNYQNGPLFTQLLSGTYGVVVMDANSCVTPVQTVQITQSTPLSLSMQIDHDTCFNACGGMAAVQVAGGVLPYSYNWYGHGTNQSYTGNLCAGNYQLRVTDSLGCSYDSLFTINQPSELQFNTITLDSVSCNGFSDGGITVSATGSVSPYSYSIDNGQNISSNNYFGSLPSNNYQITIYDSAYRCMRDTIVAVQEPTLLQVNGSFNTETICVSNCIDLSVNVSGGNGGPFNYFWSGINGTNHTVNVCPQVNSVYTVYATDIKNCVSNVDTFYVNLFDSLEVEAFSDTAICMDETVSINAVGSGGNPSSLYNYRWFSTGTVYSPNSAYNMVTPHTTTQYIVRLTDGCGSPEVFDTVTVTVFPEVVPSVDILTPLTGCEPLSVELQNTTPSTFQVDWTIGDQHFSTPNVSINELSAGTYDISLHVISTDGCEGDQTLSNTIIVNPLPDADFEMTPNPTTVFTPLVHFYDQSYGDIWNYNWDFAGLDSSFLINPSYEFPEEEGNYPITLEVTTDSGCVDTATRILVINPEYNFYIPNAFTPNSDNLNDDFKPHGIGISEQNYSFMIFDRWGNKVFETTDINSGWNGMVRGTSQEAADAVYVWKVELSTIRGSQKKTYHGKVHLIR